MLNRATPLWIVFFVCTVFFVFKQYACDVIAHYGSRDFNFRHGLANTCRVRRVLMVNTTVRRLQSTPAVRLLSLYASNTRYNTIRRTPEL